MSFDDVLTTLGKDYGECECAWKLTAASDAIQTAKSTALYRDAAKAGVPEECGVYLVYAGRADSDSLLYIGASGVFKQDGTWGGQRLLTRMTKGKYVASDGRKRPRVEQCAEWLRQSRSESLVFKWFVTHDGNHRTLPKKAEADLLQAYYDEYCKLPPRNKSY